MITVGFIGAQATGGYGFYEIMIGGSSLANRFKCFLRPMNATDSGYTQPGDSFLSLIYDSANGTSLQIKLTETDGTISIDANTSITIHEI